jgi:N-methylhydantoinase B/oxoprolinase/acetone carboxylase alpha subunit
MCNPSTSFMLKTSWMTVCNYFGIFCVTNEKNNSGTAIRLALTINRNDGTAHFDFTGTGFEVLGNISRVLDKTFSLTPSV